MHLFLPRLQATSRLTGTCSSSRTEATSVASTAGSMECRHDQQDRARGSACTTSQLSTPRELAFVHTCRGRTAHVVAIRTPSTLYLTSRVRRDVRSSLELECAPGRSMRTRTPRSSSRGLRSGGEPARRDRGSPDLTTSRQRRVVGGRYDPSPRRRAVPCRRRSGRRRCCRGGLQTEAAV